MLMMTTYVPSKIFDGIRCQAMRVCGCKYSIAVQLDNGKTYNAGANTIAEARDIIENNEKIVKLIVYVYHSKKETFEHVKTFVRE